MRSTIRSILNGYGSREEKIDSLLEQTDMTFDEACRAVKSYENYIEDYEEELLPVMDV